MATQKTSGCERLLTAQETAERLGCSIKTIRRLVAEAEAFPKAARWKHGREFIEIGLKHSSQRTFRFNWEAICHG